MFIGLDLGWLASSSSGVCYLRREAAGIEFVEWDVLETHQAVLNWLDQVIANETQVAIAIDAPLIIPNVSGMRLPDRLLHQHFGRYHAGCYPANQNLPFYPAMRDFTAALAERGFAHATDGSADRRIMLEVYPHAATITLFNLSRILKYKKGRVAERRQGLGQLFALQQRYFAQLQPQLTLNLTIDTDQKGAALKALEDKLDALTCAYLAAYWVWHGQQQNQVYGDRASGYIIVPAPGPQESARTCGTQK
ncbi:DUF429 domain-containing protein [Sphaerothrix gracilis]|uniref:DUF429 domain-containing protein n=1 Tax=Sphaerothrix gracilis TaxID=3151835 RepID=UPI0031FC6FE8